MLTLALAIDWRWLREFLAVLAATLIAAWLKAPHSAVSTRHFAGASLGLLLMMMLARMVDTQHKLRLVMLAFLGAGLGVMVIGLAAAYSPGNPPPFGATVFSYLPSVRLGLDGLEQSGAANPNAVAAVVLMVVPLGVSVLLFGSREKVDLLSLQPIGLVATMTGLVVLAICNSRSAWLAVWLTLATLLARGVQNRALRLAIGIPVIVLPLAAIAMLSSLTREQFLVKADSLWGSTNTRAQLMISGVEQFRESPWLGIGMNQFHAVPSVSSDVAHVHNIFLQTGLDLGIFGLLAYCCVLGFLLIRAHQASVGPARSARSASIGAAVALVAVTLFGLGDAVALGAKVGLFQWMAGGLILAAWRTQLAFNISAVVPTQFTGRTGE